MSATYEENLSKGAKFLLATLAQVNNEMHEITAALRVTPTVQEVTTGCDIRQFRDTMRLVGEIPHVFDIYVEAETRSGEAVCWFLNIDSKSTGWTLQRAIKRRDKQDVDLPDFSCEDFSIFARNALLLTRAFGDSAKSFNFES